jgi:outer membrane lipoprotein
VKYCDPAYKIQSSLYSIPKLNWFNVVSRAGLKGGRKMEKSYPFPSGTPYSVLGLFLLILFSGCAPISRDLRAQADRTLSLQQVSKDPEAVKGKIVIWGGEIIETINQKDGTTLIVVLQRPLDWMEEPKFQPSEGRFIILVEGYVDPYVFRRGRRLTSAGEILGRKVMRLGELEYSYPLLQSKQLYLWGEYYYSPYPYYGYYGPRWGYPYW